jgi:hypothetical protein
MVLEVGRVHSRLCGLHTPIPIPVRPRVACRSFDAPPRLQELNRLTDDANVYKMIGPALVKQDMVEAKSNVTKRLEFIKSEFDRLEKQTKELETKMQAKQQDVSDAGPCTAPPLRSLHCLCQLPAATRG